MALKLEKYHTLIEDYEAQFRKSPFRYKTKVFFLAAAGYTFLLLVLLINLALLGGLLLWQKSDGPMEWIIIGYGIFGLLLFSTIRSLCVRLPLPSGAEIQREQYSFPFRIVDSLRKPLKLRRKKIHILMDWNYNAFAFSRPLFGIFGPSKYYLGIGLPLIATLNEQQLKAMIAHELAHFSKKHSSFSSWTGRLRMIWMDLLTRLDNKPFTGLPFRAFARWYSRYFEAATIVLMRQDELEADALAASATSERTVGQVLLKTALRAETVVEKYWNEIWRNVLVTPEPSRKAVSRLLFRLNEPLDRETALDELRWKMGDASEVFDSHPPLSERLRALNIKIPENETDLANFLDEWSLIRGESSVGLFLGNMKKGSEVFLDAVWEIVNHPLWYLLHEESKPVKAMLVSLDDEWREKGRLSIEKAWKRANITIQYYGVEDALPILDYILKLDESHPHANFHKGCQLLRNRDSLGILHVENAIEKDPLSYQEAGLAILSDYFRRMGDDKDFRETRHESFSANEETHLAIRERLRKVSFFNSFEPHGLDSNKVDELVEYFETNHDIRKVFLVRRRAEHLPSSSDYIFVILLRWGTFSLRRMPGTPGDPFPFSRSFSTVVTGRLRFLLRRKISRVEDSLIYKAPFFAPGRRRKRQLKQTKSNPPHPPERIA